MSEGKKLEKIGVLWVHESKKGVKYLSGSCQDKEVVVFKNRNKRDDHKDPDWLIYVSEKHGHDADPVTG